MTGDDKKKRNQKRGAKAERKRTDRSELSDAELEKVSGGRADIEKEEAKRMGRSTPQ